jgi:alkanesulfonate monooxygenase SsuD/methylene tetrahydromethanopterin reductase-like flavin-dependent oxidoreductase (luciferase family)
LAKARSALTSFISGEDSAFVDEPPPRQERENAAGKALRNLDDMFGLNRIFVPKSVAEKIDEIRQAYGAHYMFGLAGHSSQDEDDRAAILEDAARRITAISVTALLELETEFRKLLGDEIGPSNQR